MKVFYFLAVLIVCNVSFLSCMQEQKRRATPKKYLSPNPGHPLIKTASQQHLTSMLMHLTNEARREELFFNDKSEGKGTQNL